MATGLVSTLFGGGIQGAGQGIAAVIDAIKGKNPEDAAKIQELLTKHEDTVLQINADLAKAKIDENVQLNSIAGQNVRADATSGDKFTARARPAVIWVGLFIMAWNYVVVPLLAIRFHIQIVTFPDMFWETWGVLATGIVVARTADKATQTLLGGSGGTATLPFGMKLESKGD